MTINEEEHAQRLASTIMLDIVEMQAKGELPRVRSFAELHDHCDANMLGQTEWVLRVFALEYALRIIDAAQAIVDEKLRED